MKSIANMLIAAGLIFVVLSFVEFNSSENAIGVVNQLQGLYIFTDSKPANEYEHLGTIKVKIVLYDASYSHIRNIMIKRALKEYPKAEGLIITPGVADVIKFKD